MSCALQEEGKHGSNGRLVLGCGKLVGSRSAGCEERLWERADQHRVFDVVEEPEEDRVEDFIPCQVGKRLASAPRCTQVDKGLGGISRRFLGQFPGRGRPAIYLGPMVSNTVFIPLTITGDKDPHETEIKTSELTCESSNVD